MSQVPVVVLSDAEWRTVLEEHGHGMVAKRFRCEECVSEDERFAGHTVVHGRHTQTGELTDTGFLQNHRGEIVAGVDGIPV